MAGDAGYLGIGPEEGILFRKQKHLHMPWSGARQEQRKK